MTPCCTASLQMSRKFFLLMALAFLRVTLGWLYGSECSSTTSFSHAIDVRRISRIRNRVRSRKVARIKTNVVEASNMSLVTSGVRCRGRRSVVVNVAQLEVAGARAEQQAQLHVLQRKSEMQKFTLKLAG